MSRTSRKSKRDLGWRASILEHFTPEIAAVTRLTIVSDPDHLLTEQTILGELQARGFDLMPFDDHVAFRFAYESRYRQIWDRGEETNLVVVLRSLSGDVDALPYDLLERARCEERCLSFSVGELFPSLAPNVVLDMDRSYFDALFAAQAQDDTACLGENATKDFVLRHVFEIAPELIKTPANLLRVLLRRHYRGLSFPQRLDRRFIHLLRESGHWSAWPLEEIVPRRSAFLAFLDERWPYFVKQVVEAQKGVVGEPVVPYGLRFTGPVDLPFGHDDIKVYIDNLFQEGRLTPVGDYRPDDVPEMWMRVGVAGSHADDRIVRFERLLDRLEADFPAEDANHRNWVNYTRTWAEWAALRWELEDDNASIATDRCEHLHDRIEMHFADWMQRNYASLYNLSPMRPAMVHHIPRHMALSFIATGAQAAGSAPSGRHALVVVDGLAFDQWVVLRNEIFGRLGKDVQMEEDGSFAWVPTLTGVSRQAVFAGMEPMFFADSLGDTSRDNQQWRRFWEECGAKRAEIGYVREGKNQTNNSFLDAVFEIADNPRMRVLGIVVGTVDKAVHGVPTGSAGLHAIVRQWAGSGAMDQLISGLLDRGFDIVLTSDHGNIHGHGIGKPNVGAIADERGERVHVFNDERIREAVAKDYPAAIKWPQIGLPNNYWPLLASGRGAFLAQGRHTVGHGGISMEEVIVPFVKIRRGSQ